MEDGQIGRIILIIIFMICSAFFSSTETAYSAVNRIRLKRLSEEGNKKATQALQLTEEYDTLLSTILVGNNIVNIAMASVATVLFVSLLGDRGVTVSTIIITILVLLFSEVTPKTLAKQFPERFAMATAPLMRLLLFTFIPINFLFGLWRKLLATIVTNNGEEGITEEELLTIVDEAQQEGAITLEDKELIDSVIDFNDRKVGTILTPRIDIDAVEINDSIEEIQAKFIETGYSRLPVFREEVDYIIGFIHLRDFFQLIAENKTSIESIISDIFYVTTNTPISQLLKLHQKSRSHLAVVTNEYGGTVGIVTMEDILEELVGEIWDEHDDIIEEIVQIDAQTFRILGSADAEKVMELLNIEDDDFISTTISGWIMERLQHMPEEWESFTYNNLSIHITKMDRQRVEECMIQIDEPYEVSSDL